MRLNFCCLSITFNVLRSFSGGVVIDNQDEKIHPSKQRELMLIPWLFVGFLGPS